MGSPLRGAGLLFEQRQIVQWLEDEVPALVGVGTRHVLRRAAGSIGSIGGCVERPGISEIKDHDGPEIQSHEFA